MQAATERLEERKASFKAGPDGTRKRDEHQSLIRKDKRKKLLEQRRGGGEAASAASLAGGIGGDGGAAPNVLAGMQQYNKDALLAGNPQQLLLLVQLLQHCTQTQAEEYLPHLLWNKEDPVVIRYLVNQCFFNEVALRALVNATHHVTTHDAAMAYAILSAGYVEGMAKAITGLRLSSVHHALLWDVAINLVLSCPEGRAIIFKHCCPGGGLPFMEVLRYANQNHDAALQSALIHLIGKLVDRGAPLLLHKNGESDISSWFQSVFTHLLFFLMSDVQPLSHRDMPPALLATIGRAVDALSECILAVPNKEMVLVPVMLEMGLERMFRHLVALCEAQSQKNQVAILLLLGRMSLFNVRGNPFHEAAHRCGVYRLMVHNATRPDSVAARAHAFLSFGNYLADHYQTVGYLMGVGAIPVMLDAIRREQHAVRRQALFAVRAMVAICDDMRRSNMEFSQEAGMILQSLVVQHKLLDPVVPFISVEDLESARDAIDILSTLLKWDKDCVMRTVAGQEAEDRIQLLLPELKAQRVGTAFYNAICEVEILMDLAAAADGGEMDQGADDYEAVMQANDGKPFYF